MSKNGINFHFYTDDTQIYLSFKSKAVGEPLLSRSRVELCIHDVNQWMTAKLIVLHARHRPPLTLDSILVGSNTIHASNSAKIIGAWFDNVMSMNKQITNICKCSFYHLRNIAKISRFISFRHCETLIHAFVTSKIDYCNIILSGLKQDQIQNFNTSKIQLPDF